MKNKPKSIVVTGGAGFIGANFVNLALRKNVQKVVVVDKLTYAGNLSNLKPVARDKRLRFIKADIANRKAMVQIFKKYRPDTVVNFAAESHVDRSIDSPQDFIFTNVVGTFQLLDVFREFLKKSPVRIQKGLRFLHVSTDEVYGSLGRWGKFKETTSYAPNSPYSASKAGADHLVRAYGETYQLPVLITNCSNNYGPYQFPEKLIPLMILNAIEGKPLPVYGDGQNVRDWLFVEDHCEGIWTVLEKGGLGEKYNIGGGNEWNNLRLVKKICDVLEKLYPIELNLKIQKKNVKSYSDLIKFVKDRPGHDRRYAIDSGKIQRELGWKPTFQFEEGLEKTIQWYLENLPWCESVQSGTYRRSRLGLKV